MSPLVYRREDDADGLDFMEAIRWASPLPRPASGRYPNLSPISSRRFQKSGLLWTPTPQNPSRSEASGLFDFSSYLSSFQIRLTPQPSTYQGIFSGLSFPSIFGSPKLESPKPLPVERRQMPVIGFRAWDAVSEQRLGCEPEWTLESLGKRGWHWKPGANHATCDNGTHQVPDERCGCGLYVMADLDTLQTHVGALRKRLVVGAVMGWGRVVQHGTEGWRAECARPLALLDLKLGRKNRAITEAVADAYGLPVLERSALELVVREHGDPLPENAP